MQAFIAADQFIAESKSRHQASFLHPEDRAETAAEENTFHCCKSTRRSAKVPFSIQRNAHSAFFFTAGNGINGMKQTIFFFGIFNIGINQQGVGFEWIFSIMIWKP